MKRKSLQGNLHEGNALVDSSYRAKINADVVLVNDDDDNDDDDGYDLPLDQLPVCSAVLLHFAVTKGGE